MTKTDDNIYDVNIEHLIINIGKYHGLTIQTRGMFEWRFETSGLFPATPIFDSTTITFKIKSMPGIWVEQDTQFISYDSVRKFTYSKSGKLATVQGRIDTTRTGHMGEYVATLTKARFIVSQ